MIRSLSLLIVVFALGTHVGAAQEAPPVKLKPADATLKGLPFNSVTDVRELADGRVLFHFETTNVRVPGHMAVADMKNGRTDSVPNFPDNDMHALAADTTLVGSNGGWVFAKGTKVLGMLEATNPVVVAASNLIGADSNGFLVALREGGADSMDVIRVNRATAEVLLLARVKKAPGARAGIPASLYNGLREYVVYTSDGWLGIQRIAPYRVDWRSPDGKWTLGKPIPVPTVKFDERERLAHMAQNARLRGDSIPRLPSTIKVWPEAVEPAYGEKPLATSDGKMLVYRTPTADFPERRYDVVNREGVVERQIVLSADEKIVGFGTKSVYVRFGKRRPGSTMPLPQDTTWQVRLERHPWP